MREGILTLDVAEEWLAAKSGYAADEVSDLSQYTGIDDSAAESLSKYEDELSLGGLTELSDAAAESLSKHQGEYLKLDGLTELSDSAAESLSKYQGDYLGLSEELEEQLAKYR